jgi:tRNA pseudouridine38-40 synthase
MGMKNIKLLIEYDGANYHGWQRQKNHTTLQEIIEGRLLRITGEDAALISASRTDAGVHAVGQVASFKTNSNLEPVTLQRALNATLPEDIRILNAWETAAAFHPRYDALGKSYFYIIFNTNFSSAFLYRYAWRVPYTLDLDAMKKAGDSLLGRHDFSAFRGAGCGAKSTVREITSVRIERISSIDFMTAKINGNFIKITVEATAFLRHMVRNIVGTLVEVGRGKMTLDSISEAIKLKDRGKTGPTAPAHGLFLEKVSYPET